ncbi:Minor capsid protein VP1 [Frankliniella fusca]|uniref:Minor capsid protein VP1 n=1 Tax=Frankliniella fusca TaxID=407009 RepID=A0AAE1HPD0_9NEOP|nr:Minor capsid protein VP1 [Frankliniella fusca]
MVGNTNVPQNWYKSLRDGPQNTVDLNHDLEKQETETLQISSPNAVDIEDCAAHIANDNNQEAVVIENVSYNASEVEEWRTKLKEMFYDLDTRLAAKPELFLPGVRTLVNSYNKVRQEKSENGIASALFGMKNGLKTGHRIRLQPTAAPRRKRGNKHTQPHLRPRACKQTGKPPKAARAGEHGYSTQKRKGQFAPAPPAKERHIAAHNLEQRDENTDKSSSHLTLAGFDSKRTLFGFLEKDLVLSSCHIAGQ